MPETFACCEVAGTHCDFYRDDLEFHLPMPPSLSANPWSFYAFQKEPTSVASVPFCGDLIMDRLRRMCVVIDVILRNLKALVSPHVRTPFKKILKIWERCLRFKDYKIFISHDLLLKIFFSFFKNCFVRAVFSLQQSWEGGSETPSPLPSLRTWPYPPGPRPARVVHLLWPTHLHQSVSCSLWVNGPHSGPTLWGPWGWANRQCCGYGHTSVSTTQP